MLSSISEVGETPGGNNNMESRDHTDSASDLLFGISLGREDNHTFPRRRKCSSLINRKIDFNKLLEEATEEDKRANTDLTHPPYGQPSSWMESVNDENIAPPPLNLSSSRRDSNTEPSALDLSSVKNASPPKIPKHCVTPSNKQPLNVTPLQSLASHHNIKYASSEHVYEKGISDSAKKYIYLGSSYEHVISTASPFQGISSNIANRPTNSFSRHDTYENQPTRSSNNPMQTVPTYSMDSYKNQINYPTTPQHIHHQPLPTTHDTFAVPELPTRFKSNNKEIHVNGRTYQVLALLGKGGSSKVYLALAKDNSLLAIKCVNLNHVDEKTKMDHLNEIDHLMKMQNCRHIIKVIDHEYVMGRKLLYAVMERGDTDLSRLLKERMAQGEGVPPEMIAFYWSEMLLAVKSIHDQNIIHRDLKPANFLLVAGRLKLIDFGIASTIQSEQTSVFKDSQSGTPNYMSPEAWEDLGVGNERLVKIGRKTDVWSLGCILYSFLYGKTPFQEYTNHLAKFRVITDPKHQIAFPPVPGVSQVLIESCRRCLIHDKNKRASIDELLALKNQVHMTGPEAIKKLEAVLDEDSLRKAKEALAADTKT